MQTFITLVMAAIFGALCSRFATKRGRDSVAWFAIGFLLGAIGLLLLFILPSKRAPKPSLVMNTGAAAPVQTKPELPTTAYSPTLFWYYLDAENKQLGPMSFEALYNLHKENKVADTTYVWNEEMEGWKLFKDVVDYKK